VSTLLLSHVPVFIIELCFKKRVGRKKLKRKKKSVLKKKKSVVHKKEEDEHVKHSGNSDDDPLTCLLDDPACDIAPVFHPLLSPSAFLKHTFFSFKETVNLDPSSLTNAGVCSHSYVL